MGVARTRSCHVVRYKRGRVVKNLHSDRSALSGHVPDALLRRRTDLVTWAKEVGAEAEAQPAQPVPYREALAKRLSQMVNPVNDFGKNQLLLNAAEKLRRDEQNNAECIDILVRAGYRDIPAQVNAELIRRLLGFITPGV
jgi:hypothetical protein